jgi:large subunit ribosomal protein L21e
MTTREAKFDDHSGAQATASRNLASERCRRNSNHKSQCLKIDKRYGGGHMRHSHGYRSRCRKLLRKHPRERGYGGLSRLMYEYNINDKVVVDINPTFIETAPHRRYQGRVGRIIEKRGKAYVIEILLGSKIKKIITTPEHIKPLPTQQAR